MAAVIAVTGCKNNAAADTADNDSDSSTPQPAAIQVVSGLQMPVALAFLSATRWLVAERGTGNIRWVQDGRLRPEPFASLPAPEHPEENGYGLRGLAVDPDYPTRPFVYVSYAGSTGAGKPTALRVLRYTVQAGTGINPLTVIDNLPLGGHGDDIGGSLLFGADGKLYIAVGDADRPDQAQNYDALIGKVLRYDPDGSIPADNPLEQAQTGSADNPDNDAKQLEGDKTPVYTIGQHDPYGMALNPETGNIYLVDDGPGHDDGIYRLVAADNYGWPAVTGDSQDPRYHPPLWSSGKNSFAPSGAAFYNGTALPQFQGNLLFASAKDGKLRRAIFSGSDEITGIEVIPAAGDRARYAVAMGLDGNLYFTSTDSVYKLAAM